MFVSGSGCPGVCRSEFVWSNGHIFITRMWSVGVHSATYTLLHSTNSLIWCKVTTSSLNPFIIKTTLHELHLQNTTHTFRFSFLYYFFISSFSLSLSLSLSLMNLSWRQIDCGLLLLYTLETISMFPPCIACIATALAISSFDGFYLLANRGYCLFWWSSRSRE